MNCKDYSLHSGERQTGRTLQDIRRDHVARYELAERIIAGRTLRDAEGVCFDIFCGNGYGTYLVAQRFPSLWVLGIDGSAAAIAQANECYSVPNSLFSHKLFPFTLPERTADFVLCFESLEHVAEDKSMLEQMLRSLKVGGVALVSVPNQELHSLDKNPHPFHFRHYTKHDFLSMLPAGFALETWFGQNVYEFTPEGVNTFRLLAAEDMEVKEQTPGQVNIFLLFRVR